MNLPHRTPPACIAAFYEAFNTGDLSLCAQAVSTDWENLPREPGQGSGVEAFEHTVRLYREAMHDLHIALQTVICDGDHVALHIRITGRATGSLCALVEAVQREAPGTPLAFDAHDIHTLQHGRIVRSRHIEDWVGIFRQAGLHY